MKRQVQFVANILLLGLITLILTALQTSLWLQLFGFFPPPQIWVVTLAYIALYRNFFEALLLTYFISFAVSPMTGMPMGLVVLVNICLFLMWLGIKQRIYWTGPTFLMLMAGLGTFFFPVIHFISSLLIEKNSIDDIAVFHWIMSSLLTALVALPLHKVFDWVDTWTNKELPTEAGAFYE